MATSGNNDEIFKVLNLVQQQLAVASERERQMRESIAELADSVKALGVEISEMKNMANRWKGGFLVLTALGGIIGWFLSSIDTLSGLFGK